MGADISRILFKALENFTGVDLKQGAVLLDADFNELGAIVDRRIRALASDVLERTTVSANTPDAFKISLGAGGGLQIGKGRLYVDGLLAENHGAPWTDPAKKQFDPLMAETQFPDAVRYDKQPYLPSAPPLPPGGRHLVYLDVWDREVTHLERPDLVEVAVGVESSTRRQTVWQVQVFEAKNATCATPDGEIKGWATYIGPSSGRLTTGTFDVPPEQDPCELPPSGGYRGLENQTYRVEIHDPGQPGGKATFKWSRDNASVGSRVASVVSQSELELDSLGRDDVLRFNTGDWVEITDDVREMSQQCGEMRRITVVNEAARHITFMPGLPNEMIPPPAVLRDRNLRVRRWDQHKVLTVASDGTTPVFCDVDTGATGVIPVPASGTLLLENGVTVSFTSAAGENGLRAGDYWVFAARTADASVELLENEPPRGIHHHYARLAIWDVDSAAPASITDCRTHWPPESGKGHDCSCTVCVSPDLHASDAIQAAVNQIRDTGGTVCLAVGRYILERPVQLAGKGVRIKGQGPATVLEAKAGAFIIASAIAPVIEDLTILSFGQQSCITARTVQDLTLQRLAILVARGNDKASAAIALSGAVIGATIRDNAIIAPVGIQTENDIEGQHVPLLLTAGLRIEDNGLQCVRSAVVLGQGSLHVMATRITGNNVIDCREVAIAALGHGGLGASFHIERNSLNVHGPGIVAALDGLWIEGNKLTSTPDDATRGGADAGIALRTGLDKKGSEQCQILSNQISGFSGAGIAINAPTRALIVKLNSIQRCGNGIVCEEDAVLSSVSIENNQLSEIGRAAYEGKAFVVGIGISRAETASVVGNTIHGIFSSGGPLRAGILAAGVQRFRVSGNDVTDVAQQEFVDLGAGIIVRAPYDQVEITSNHVARDAQSAAKNGGSRWLALVLDAPPGEGQVSRVGTLATVGLDKTRMLVFSGSRPYIVTAPIVTDALGAIGVPGANATIHGNVFLGRGTASAVDAAVRGDCVFAHNQCELRSDTGMAVVRLTAGTIIANANRIQGGKPSMELAGNTSLMTVLGNITTAGIFAGGVPLGDPWSRLNVPPDLQQ